MPNLLQAELQRAVNASGLTRAGLAAKAGCSAPYIGDLLRGSRVPTTPKGYRRVGKIFGIAPELVAMLALADAGFDLDELDRALGVVEGV